MNFKPAAALFFIIAILFAATSICLGFIPKTTTKSHSDYAANSQTYKTTKTTTTNLDFGAISAGIISACCFFVSGNLISKSHKLPS